MKSFVESAKSITSYNPTCYCKDITEIDQRMFMNQYRSLSDMEFLTCEDMKHNIYFLLLMAAIQGEI